MQHIIIDLITLVLFDIFGESVVDAKQVVSEGWHHEELLKHAVHVADAAEVAKAAVLLAAINITGGGVAPGIRLDNR